MSAINMKIVFNVIFICFLIIEWQSIIVCGYSFTNATDSVLGCSHNSSRFANGSFVPTVEPCLSCKCINANLICSLRICPEQPFPPPRGCVIVHKRDACCPYITCSKLHTTTKTQDDKVITHDRKWYEQNIKNRIFSQNAIQRRIEETDHDGERIGNEKMCVHNGTVYRSGSAMTTSSLCSYCYCIGGKQKCVKPKCTLPAKGCEPIFIDSSCCPIKYDCTPNKRIKTIYESKNNRQRTENKHYLRMTSRMQRSRGCLVSSVFYPEGHKLPTNETNPCEICFCIGGSKRCAPKKCAPMIKNCMPIIPDGQCCPSSYECNHRSKLATAREFSPRQYDFFSLLFGEEGKENSTATWDDYESETESINPEIETNTTNEKGLLDAIKDSLNYVDGSKKPSLESIAYIRNSTAGSVPNASMFNENDEEDEEEVSLLDYFLNGGSAFTPTTPKTLSFNITGKPLANDATNSPMNIKPILDESAKNESMKFALLPMSLYNMVKDDGSIAFENGKSSTTPNVPTTKQSTISTTEMPRTKSPNVEMKPTNPPKVHVPEKKSTTTTTTTTEAITAINKDTQKVVSATEKNELEKLDHTTVKPITLTTVTPKSTTQMKDSTVFKIKTTNPPSTAIVTRIRSTQKPATSTQKKVPLVRTTPSTHSSTPQVLFHSASKSPNPPTPPPMQILTTKSIPRPTPSQETNSNPSILESDINYDYSEPTLPPSLPNLKIIPFLPTDAVKNTISKSGTHAKPNFNYYQSNTYSGPYSQIQSHTEHTNYSPFSSKPNRHEYYSDNKANDRIDYETYKPPAENKDNSVYANIYGGISNGPPRPIQMNVNAHFNYDANDHNLSPSRVPVPNRNLTVKPPLPPFEPEYEYELYNLPPNVQVPPSNNYNAYNVHAQNTNDEFSSEHNYNVPHFVTIPPIKNPAEDQHDTIFSYAPKNKFIPPLQTEGGFVPKRVPTGENYIPIRGNNFYLENVDDKIMSLDKNSNETQSALSQENDEKSVISITTGSSYMPPKQYADASDALKDQLSVQEVLDEIQSGLAEYEEPTLVNHSYDISIPNEESMPNSSEAPVSIKSTEAASTTYSSPTEPTQKPVTKNTTSDQLKETIPLKLISILHNTKKESPEKAQIPQRKNNKIIDPTDEPLIEETSIHSRTTEMPKTTDHHRDAFISSLNRPTDISDDLFHSSIFLQRPINKLSPSFIGSASFPGLVSANTIESKHNFQSNTIRSELDLIIPELNKNKQTNDFTHTNNFSSENYQVLPPEDTNISNTESYVVNPVDVDKLKQHQSQGETKIYTPPHKDPAGLFKLDGCNIYGRMYRVNRIIAELSSSCLECRCTEVGVACTPLNC